MLSLGLGLTVLAAISQIDANMQARIQGDTSIETAPMLRGVITRINGETAREVVGDHWVLRGDRGVSYSDAPPEDAQITEGSWWPAD